MIVSKGRRIMTENRKPKIALVCSRAQNTQPNRVTQDSGGITYTTSIIKAGGYPFLVPLDFPLDELSELRGFFDGLLLMGGGDVEISRYGGKDHPSVGEVCPIRDEVEIRLARLAYETGWPIFGICRGVQVMNVAADGKLYSDIPDQLPGARFVHSSPDGTPRDHIVHRVRILPDTLLSRIIGKETVPVNSFHHQAVSELGGNFRLNAWSEDDVPEGIELPDHPFALGVQWHPECMQQYDDHMKLFRAFVDACRK